MNKLIALTLVMFFMTGCLTNRTRIIKNNTLLSKSEVKYEVSEEGIWVPAKIQRVWVSPHVDSDTGDFIQGHYKCIVLDPGHWKAQEEI